MNPTVVNKSSGKAYYVMDILLTHRYNTTSQMITTLIKNVNFNKICLRFRY